jgi:hypothetical protein
VPDLPAHIDVDARTLTCVCGITHELNDLMDESPPIPARAWPRRWTITYDGSRGTECFVCGHDHEDLLDAVLPDYPWRTDDRP